tara:strand:- start:31 stop:264 length:234 start_codon:yes stop_codon:yes gene_type:complete
MRVFPINLSPRGILILGDAKKIIKTPKKLKNIPNNALEENLCDRTKTDNIATNIGLKPITKEASEAAVLCIPYMYPT